MADLSTRIYDFLGTLSGYKHTDKPSGPTVDVYNALLQMAKEALPDDPVVQVSSPIEKDVVGGSSVDVGSMRAVMDQVQSALDQTGPAIG